jgi:hypothetical protein
MKHISKIMAAAICLIAAVIVVLKVSSNRAADGNDSGSVPIAPLSGNTKKSNPETQASASDHTGGNPQDAAARQIDPAEAEKIRVEALEKIHDASVSYDPAELPVIRPYLLSSDPELRAAAVDAMIVLGDASAGPMLREAAKSLASEEEAKQMLKAADYVELPPANIKEVAEKMRKNRETKQQK